MAYDHQTAQRIRRFTNKHKGLVEKQMFGGIGFILHGNMACGLYNDFLIVRVGAENYSDAVMRPHTRPFDITGHSMTGWVMVHPDGYANDEDLNDWVQTGLDFARTLPPK